MEKGDKGFGIARVPRGSLRVNHRLYFFLHGVRAGCFETTSI